MLIVLASSPEVERGVHGELFESEFTTVGLHLTVDGVITSPREKTKKTKQNETNEKES
jgi:hypothetical protein